MDDDQDAIDNCRNKNQADYKTVLCICSAGLLRSPTAAFVLSQPPYNYNTRACGTESYALILFNSVLIEWADEIVIMGGKEHEIKVRNFPHFLKRPKPIKVLDIPDRFQYRDEKLIELIKKRYEGTEYT